jgi:hypothetical protein
MEMPKSVSYPASYAPETILVDKHGVEAAPLSIRHFDTGIGKPIPSSNRLDSALLI